MNVTRWDHERAVTASSLPAPSRHLLHVLAIRADADTGIIPAEYSPSHTQLAQDTGLSRRTVIDHLAAVERAGWLGVKRAPVAKQRAEHAPNQYRLALPKHAAKLVQQPHPAAPKASAAPAPGGSAGAAQASATAAHNQTKELTTNYQAAAAASRTSAGAHTRDRLAQLDATAVRRPDAYALVSSWAQHLTTPLLDTQRRDLAKTVDTLLAEGAQLPILRTALDDWATRGRTPAFLRYCYQDAAQRARAAETGPGALDVPGSRVHQPAPGSDRASKALGFLDPRDPYLARQGAHHHQPQQLSPGEFRVIEGGRTA
jgi:hypothetical protein